jgi:hypothetical protein
MPGEPPERCLTTRGLWPPEHDTFPEGDRDDSEWQRWQGFWRRLTPRWPTRRRQGGKPSATEWSQHETEQALRWRSRQQPPEEVGPDGNSSELCRAALQSPPLALSSDAPWREANKYLTPSVPVSRSAAERLAKLSPRLLVRPPNVGDAASHIIICAPATPTPDWPAPSPRCHRYERDPRSSPRTARRA